MSTKCSILKLEVSKDDIKRIQQQSVGQFGNTIFEEERVLRLTASLFVMIVNRRPHTPCHNTVKACLNPSVFSTATTQYGICKENVAILQFQDQYNIQVEKSGLWVDEKYGFLGASPDGTYFLQVVCYHYNNLIFLQDLLAKTPWWK